MGDVWGNGAGAARRGGAPPPPPVGGAPKRGAPGAPPPPGQDALVHAIAGLHDQRDRRNLDVVGFLVHERLVHVGVELVAHRPETLQPVGGQGVLELLGDGVERCPLGDVAVLAAQLHVVQNPDERGQDATHGHLLARLRLRLDAAPGVDVIRLLPLQLLGELGDLALERGDLPGLGRSCLPFTLRGLLEELCGLRIDRVDRLRGSRGPGRGGPGGADASVLRVHLALVGEGEPRLPLGPLAVVGSALVLGHHLFSSSSSTISASTTSSSSDDGVDCPASSAAPSPSASACE